MLANMLMGLPSMKICMHRSLVTKMRGTFAIMGDFNSRNGVKTDFIERMNMVIDREVLDLKQNAYSDLFSEFLISGNCVMLNGRSNKANDYTCVSIRGHSIVD